MERDVIGSIRYCRILIHILTLFIFWLLHRNGATAQLLSVARYGLTKFKFMLSHGVVKGVKSIFFQSIFFSPSSLMRIILPRI